MIANLRKVFRRCRHGDLGLYLSNCFTIDKMMVNLTFKVVSGPISQEPHSLINFDHSPLIAPLHSPFALNSRLPFNSFQFFLDALGCKASVPDSLYYLRFIPYDSTEK